MIGPVNLPGSFCASALPKVTSAYSIPVLCSDFNTLHKLALHFAYHSCSYSTYDSHLNALIKENPFCAFSFSCGMVFLSWLVDLAINHHSTIFFGTHFSHTAGQLPKKLSPWATRACSHKQ